MDNIHATTKAILATTFVGTVVGTVAIAWVLGKRQESKVSCRLAAPKQILAEHEEHEAAVDNNFTKHTSDHDNCKKHTSEHDWQALKSSMDEVPAAVVDSGFDATMTYLERHPRSYYWHHADRWSATPDRPGPADAAMDEQIARNRSRDLDAAMAEQMAYNWQQRHYTRDEQMALNRSRDLDA
jgi:hypothetical protein